MLRANGSSVLPPKFREISALCRYRAAAHTPRCPIPLPCNGRNPLEPTGPPRIRRRPLGPLLEGYFHNPLTKTRTFRLFSGHWQAVYSSLSLHLAEFEFIIEGNPALVNFFFFRGLQPSLSAVHPLAEHHRRRSAGRRGQNGRAHNGGGADGAVLLPVGDHGHGQQLEGGDV